MRDTEACIARVMARGSMGHKEALDLLEEVAERGEAAARTGVQDPMFAAAFELATKLKEGARLDRLDALRNAAKRGQWKMRGLNEADGRVAPHTSANLVPTNPLTLSDGIRSVLHFMPGAKNQTNVEGMWHQLEGRLVAPLGNRLRSLGLLKAAEADGERYGISEVLWRKSGAVPDATTPSKNAEVMGEAMDRPLQVVHERLNAEGARQGKKVGYVTHTTWNSRQLQLAAGPGASWEEGYQAWKKLDAPRMAESSYKDVKPYTKEQAKARLDSGKMEQADYDAIPAGGETQEQARDRFLRSFYAATRTGIHLGVPSMDGMGSDGEGYIPPVYEGTHNVARSVSHASIIDWKSSRDWADHMRDFGGGESIYSNVQRTLSVGARKIALMEHLGTNPEANFETLVQQLTKEYRTHPELNAMLNQLNGVRNALGRLTGRLNMPVHEDAGNLYESTRNWLRRKQGLPNLPTSGTSLFEPMMSAEATMHLGGVQMTHALAGPFTVGSELAHHGVNRFDSLAGVLRSALSRRGTEAATQEALADNGAYVHGYQIGIRRAVNLGDAWSRDGLPGWSSRVAASFMHWTGIDHFLGNFQAMGIKGTLMDRLGRAINGEFGDIEIHQRSLLSRYGIGPDEWRLLRGSSEPSIGDGGRRWVTSSDAINSDKAAVEAVLRARAQIGKDATPEAVANKVQGFQWDLADRLGQYLNDAARRGTVSAGIRERAITLQSAQPGSWGYMAGRALFQFKMWSLAEVNQGLGRDLIMSLSKRESATNILWGIVGLATLGGAARMTLNDFIAGRPQRDWRSPTTWLAAAAQGGGIGIWGDFLFGEVNRMGGSMLGTLAGPLAGDAERAFTMLWQNFRGDLAAGEGAKALRHLAGPLMHFAVGHVPFANLIYLKGTLDYLLWYHLYELASPGWWERTNRRLAKEQGRVMTGYTPGGKIPYTPMGLGAPTMSVPAAH